MYEYAQKSQSLIQALFFLVSWPALDRAAALVVQRSGELDGGQYEILPWATDALAAKHPLAAMLVLRALIDVSLTHSRSSRYRHTARHFLECSSLSSAIRDFGAFETHDDYAQAAKGACKEDFIFEPYFLKHGGGPYENCADAAL